MTPIDKDRVSLIRERAEELSKTVASLHDEAEQFEELILSTLENNGTFVGQTSNYGGDPDPDLPDSMKGFLKSIRKLVGAGEETPTPDLEKEWDRVCEEMGFPWGPNDSWK